MSLPDWRTPDTHARHVLDHGMSPLDTALHLARYQWVRDTFCRADAVVLDLGCGTGYGVACLAEASAEVVGVDFSADGLAAARARYPLPNVEFVEADLTDPDLAAKVGESRFDLVTSMETIEHLEDYFTFVASAARALTPDGTFVIGTPNRRMTYERRPGRRHMDPSHVQEFTRIALEHTLSEHFGSVELHFESVPGYWGERQRFVSPEPSRRAQLARDWLPPAIEPRARRLLARVRGDAGTEPTAWTTDHVEIGPADRSPDGEAEAFCLLAVCRQPRSAR